MSQGCHSLLLLLLLVVVVMIVGGTAAAAVSTSVELRESWMVLEKN